MSIQPTASPAAPEAARRDQPRGAAAQGQDHRPALLQHGLADQAGRARTTARGRRINPVRRTG